MSAPLRIAALSAWHVHAEEYAREAQNHPDTELAAVWDEDAERGNALAETLGVEFIGDLDALLAREDLDGVTITTATTVHREVIGKVRRRRASTCSPRSCWPPPSPRARS